jgi:YD repeat-containing protein
MKISYDREVDALYIRFKETTVTTKHLEDGVALDYDKADRLAGIEILDAMKRLGDPETLKQVVFEGNALGEIKS